MTVQEAIEKIAELINFSAKSLITAMKYVYYISYEDFYSINIKDIFKISLNNVADYSVFEHIGLRLENDKIQELNTDEFRMLEGIIRYSFAVRIPFIKRLTERNPLRDNNLHDIYDYLTECGLYNPDEIIELDYKTASWMVKTKKPEPIYDVEWFRRWVYTYGGDLTILNNRNLFLMGCVDALLPLYYSSIQDKITEIIGGIN